MVQVDDKVPAQSLCRAAIVLYSAPNLTISMMNLITSGRVIMGSSEFSMPAARMVKLPPPEKGSRSAGAQR
jgi:hypothetical protein